MFIFFFRIRPPPRSTRTAPLLPYPTLFRSQDHITLEMAPLEIRHRSVRPISAKHAQASRFLQQSPVSACLLPKRDDDDGSPDQTYPSGRRRRCRPVQPLRSEEHTSELQSLMRSSYAVFCLKKKKQPTH